MSNSLAPENTRARLITAATADIRQIGAKRMTILALADKLGMSHANVYRFFADKAALIDAVLNAFLKPLEMRLAEIVDGPDPAYDKLERFLTTLTRAYAEGLKQDAAVFRLFDPIGGAKLEVERHLKRVEDLLIRIVEEGIATRLFHGNDPRKAAQLVLDLSFRFSNPAALLLANAEISQPDARRDRSIRAIVRVLAGQNSA